MASAPFLIHDRPVEDFTNDLSEIDFPIVSPQVNGISIGDRVIDFSARLTIEDLKDACSAFEDLQYTSICPTIITTDFNVMIDNIKLITSVLDEKQEWATILLGIHLEGPFLNRACSGAHPADHIKTPSKEFVDKLLLASRLKDGSSSILMVTIAPEMDPHFRAIRQLRASGIAVSIGHFAADRKTVEGAIKAGACAFTHLWNAWAKPKEEREYDLLKYALRDSGALIMQVCDGAHIPDIDLLERYGEARTAGTKSAIVDDLSPLSCHSIGGRSKVVQVFGEQDCELSLPAEPELFTPSFDRFAAQKPLTGSAVPQRWQIERFMQLTSFAPDSEEIEMVAGRNILELFESVRS